MENQQPLANLVVTQGRCQFCHRTSNDVEQLIAGDSSFICSECARACVALLDSDPAPKKAAESGERYVFQRMLRHFAPRDPRSMTVTSRSYLLRQQADLQLALDELFGKPVVPDNFLGLHQHYRHEAVGFAKLLERDRGAIETAPAQYEEVDVGGGETVRCLKNGLWLRQDELVPFVVVLTQVDDYSGGGGKLIIEVAAPPGDDGLKLCSRIFDALEMRLSTTSCYRGRVLSLESGYHWSGQASRVRVHELDIVEREQVILPDATLQALERNVLTFASQRKALRELGISTQKGLLFHGAPGTGKTHCIRYLAGRLNDHTTLLITAEGAGLVPEYMALARLLQPAMVVIEDADLLARDRTERSNPCDEAMLNSLLNELDGLRERADVFFILTTNRPGSLEPALASRPGRIDQAIEFPLPDETHRRRLISLYSKMLEIPGSLMDDMARRTDGASPAFIKEYLRRVAQHHLEAGGAGAVSKETAEAALHEMIFSGGVLNTRLLGGENVASDA